MENSRNKSTRVQIIEHNKIIRQEEGWDQDRRWKTNILKTNTWKYIPTVCGKQTMGFKSYFSMVQNINNADALKMVE